MTLLIAALLAGAAVGTFARQVARPRRTVARRVAPYAEVARARLGARVESVPEPVLASEAARRLIGPLAESAATWIGRALRVTDTVSLDRRLRQAGSTMTVDQYRRRHLRWAITTPVACALLGAIAGSVPLIIVFLALGAVAGARRMPDQLRSMTRRRSARMRSDLPTIAGLLSPKIVNNKSLAVAVASLVNIGSGPVIDELARGLHLADAGYGLARSFELIAADSPEPAAARFYRFLATATSGGIDLPRALLDQANEMRAQRREDVERAATKRQLTMVIPNVALMAPVMILFLLAPVPRMLFGS